MARALRAGLVALALAAGCTSVMYPGPRRAAHEVAVLVSSETAVDLLDGTRFHHIHRQDGARYEVLPGRHQIGISLFIVTVIPGAYAEVERSPNEIIVCLDAHITCVGPFKRHSTGNA